MNKCHRMLQVGLHCLQSACRWLGEPVGPQRQPQNQKMSLQAYDLDIVGSHKVLPQWWQQTQLCVFCP